MQLNLPPDSLGPKPTVKQMELLKKMATPGAKIHTYTGIRSAGGAYIKYSDDPHVTEKVNQGTVRNFHDWGWLKLIKNDFRGADYEITDRAMKRIELGETR